MGIKMIISFAVVRREYQTEETLKKKKNLRNTNLSRFMAWYSVTAISIIAEYWGDENRETRIDLILYSNNISTEFGELNNTRCSVIASKMAVKAG